MFIDNVRGPSFEYDCRVIFKFPSKVAPVDDNKTRGGVYYRFPIGSDGCSGRGIQRYHVLLEPDCRCRLDHQLRKRKLDKSSVPP